MKVKDLLNVVTADLYVLHKEGWYPQYFYSKEAVTKAGYGECAIIFARCGGRKSLFIEFDIRALK